MGPDHRKARRQLVALARVSRLPAVFQPAFMSLFRGLAETAERLQRFGLEPVGITNVPVTALRVQKPVRCELIPGNEAVTLDFLDEYFTDAIGRQDWSISRSMQYRLLETYRRGELSGDLTTTDYWRWHVLLDKAGINERTSEMIARKIQGLLAIYESIRKQGYRYDDLSSYIWVLDQPLIRTRYGLDHEPHGLEIFDGHHRAAAAASLGFETIDVLLLRDVAHSTPFGVPLGEIVASAG